jgi:hypothetical protein
MIVTERKSDSIIIAGHSHIGALGVGPAKEDFNLLPVEGQDRMFGLHGAWPRSENYWRALVGYAPGNSIALLWGGNEHYSLFLIEQPLRFDFVPRRLQSLPVDGDAVIVPEALVRARFQSFLTPLHDMLAELKAQTSSRVALVGTPPPKGNDQYLRSFLQPEMSHYHNSLGLTVEQVKLTPPIIRLKLWHVLQELFQEQAEREGLEFIPVPNIVTDETGFLKPEFWEADVTHANLAYGRVMHNHLAQKL